jgi:hypothetical protein
MRLFPYPDPVLVVDAPEGHFEPGEDGGFDLPGSLFSRLHSTHHNGEKRWETAPERQKRTHGEERDRRRDPETLYNAVEQIANATRNLASPQAQPAPELFAEIAALRAEIAELRAERTAAAEDGGGGSAEDGEESNGELARNKPGSPAKSGTPK